MFGGAGLVALMSDNVNDLVRLVHLELREYPYDAMSQNRINGMGSALSTNGPRSEGTFEDLIFARVYVHSLILPILCWAYLAAARSDYTTW